MFKKCIIYLLADLALFEFIQFSTRRISDIGGFIIG